MRSLLLRAGSYDSLTPEAVGWRYLSMRIERLQPGEASGQHASGREVAVVLLEGSAVAEIGGRRWDLEGRAGVFDGPPWAVYLPTDNQLSLRATVPTELAVLGARSDRRGKPVLITPGEVEVEIRGAGSATRQINHIIPPDFPAHRLLVVEVITPAGNWSSYPPHKHDQDRPPEEARLEEFYYFRLRPRDGFAFQRVYSGDRRVDETAAVRHEDVMLVPFGYHVSAAPHAIDLYYLNGLAGDRRSMAAVDDPDLSWIRRTWGGMERDPRVPFARES